MNDEQPTDRKRRFKHTRALIKIAIDDGLTQEEIARLCRTQQSTVHKWLHGRALAQEHQLTPLVSRYGHRLNRVTSRVYLVDHLEEWRLVCVEGPIVFRYNFTTLRDDPRSKLPFIKVQVARWVVHRQDRDRFVLVELGRRLLTDDQRRRWEYEDNREFRGTISDARWVECDDDAGRWRARVHAPFDGTTLIQHCDTYMADPEALHNVHDELTVPFLLRKMVAEHGQSVIGLVRMSASG